MTMEERMTVCNMSIECGARAGLIAPDQVTFDYLNGKPHAPKGKAWDEAVKHWQTFVTDEGAQFDRKIEIDLSELKPMVTWGTNPGQGVQINQPIPTVKSLPVQGRCNPGA